MNKFIFLSYKKCLSFLMFLIRKKFITALLILTASQLFAQISTEYPTVVLPIKTTISLDMPAPFNRVEVEIVESADKKPTSISFTLDDKVLDVPNDLLMDIEFIRDIEFGYLKEPETNQVVRLYMIFESAEPTELELEVEFTGCESPCTVSERSFSTIYIDSELNLSFRK